jgi:glycosyltransferase involved in cell wall biosynthesis
MKQPTVSIILPTYNREKFLPEAFAAIASQTLTDWELIVVDDGSTDGTRDLVPRLTAEFPQPVRYLYQDNQGAYGARNTGLDHATGKYIAFYDSDDLWLSHHLLDCVAALEANPDVDWVYGACRIVDHASGREIAPSTFYVDGQPRPFMRLRHRESAHVHIIDDENAARCQILHGFFSGLQNSVIQRRLFADYRFQPTRRNAQDQIIVIKSLKNGKTLAWIDDVHVIYRVHTTNSSASSTTQDIERKAIVLQTQICGFEEILKEGILSKRESRALKQSLSAQYFWHLGYSILWMNGRRDEALRMFRRGLAYWPWRFAYLKTYLIASVRTALTSK